MLLVALVALGAFVLLAAAVGHSGPSSLDLTITHALQAWRSPGLDLFMNAVGQPGFFPQTLAVNAIIVVIVYLCRMRRAALALILAGSFTGLSGSALRYGFDRPRPTPDLVFVMQKIENGHFSFPSGHVVGFTAVLGFLMFLGWTEVRPSWHRNLLLALYAAYILLVGVSRIYVGEHWLTDVLAGYAYGTFCLVLIIALYRYLVARAAPSPPRSD